MDYIRKIHTAKDAIKKEFSLATQNALSEIGIVTLIDFARQKCLTAIPGVGKAREKEIESTLKAFLRDPIDDEAFPLDRFFEIIGEKLAFDNAEYENRANWKDLELDFLEKLINHKDVGQLIFNEYLYGSTIEQISIRYELSAETVKQLIADCADDISSRHLYRKLKTAVEVSKHFESPESFCRHIVFLSPIVNDSNMDDSELFVSYWNDAVEVCPEILVRSFAYDQPLATLYFMERQFLASIQGHESVSVLETKISETCLPKEIRTALTRCSWIWINKNYIDIHIETIGDLIKLSEREILAIRDIGQKSLEKIKLFLEDLNLHLKSE